MFTEYCIYCIFKNVQQKYNETAQEDVNATFTLVIKNQNLLGLTGRGFENGDYYKSQQLYLLYCLCYCYG